MKELQAEWLDQGQDQNSKNVTECVNLAEMNLIAGYKRTQFANMKTV